MTAHGDRTEGPGDPGERIEVLDVLRGWALLGMLLVNIDVFSGRVRTGSWSDRTTVSLIELLVEGKFVALFTFLFGLGFALQMERAAAKGTEFLGPFRRRLAGLLLIGILHGILLSSLDVLQSYALLGFLLLAFRSLANRTILLSALVCMLLPVGWEIGQRALSRAGEPSTPATVQTRQEDAARIRREGQRQSTEQRRVYTSGSYREVVAYRTGLWVRLYSRPERYVTELGRKFSLFLLGLYVGRRRVFQNLGAHLPRIRSAMWWALGIGLLVLWVSRSHSVPTWLRPLLWAGAPALAFWYNAAIVLLHDKKTWRVRLRPMASVGRMALTNYLLQSVICTTIFFHYGLGLYGRVGPLAAALMSLAIFVLQVLFSVWWLRRFRFGPAEWIWRAFTYREPQTVRR